MKKIVISSLLISTYISTSALFSMTLDELKTACRQHENNTQTLPFTSRFSCKEERSFFSKSGNDRVMLTSSNDISFRASIKDDQFNTEWSSVPSVKSHQALECPSYEQWQATASYDETIHSCDELDQIASEHDYCREKLKSIWDECANEMSQQPFAAPKSSRCQYVRTNVVKSCVQSPCTTDQTVCDVPEPVAANSSNSSRSSSVSSESSDTSRSSSDVSEEATVEMKMFGAVVAETKVNRGFMHGSHKVIAVRSVPEAGSLLHKLGLQKDFVVSQINGIRTRDMDTFARLLKLASVQSQASVEFKGNGEKFEVKRVIL